MSLKLHSELAPWARKMDRPVRLPDRRRCESATCLNLAVVEVDGVRLCHDCAIYGAREGYW